MVLPHTYPFNADNWILGDFIAAMNTFEAKAEETTPQDVCCGQEHSILATGAQIFMAHEMGAHRLS